MISKTITTLAVVVLLLPAGTIAASPKPTIHRLDATPEPGARIESNSIIDIVPDGNSIWFGTGRGIAELHLDLNAWSTINQSDGIGQGGVSAINVSDSIIWAATAYTEEINGDFYPAGGGVGFSRDRGNTWTWMRQPVDSVGETNYRPTTTNIQNVTYDIAVTDSAVWIVSWGGGLRKQRHGSGVWNVHTVDGNSFAPLTFLSHRVFSAAFDGVSLWIGSAAGIHRTNDEGAHWQTFTHVPGDRSSLSGNFVTAMSVQHLPGKSLIWAATWKAEQTHEYYGVSVTDDNGLSWRVALSDSTIIDGNYLIDIYGPLRAHNFGFADSTVYVSADEVLWQSDDLGVTWSERVNDRLPIRDFTTGEELVMPDFFSANGSGDSLWVGTDDGLAVGWFNGASYEWRIHRAFELPKVNNPDTYSYPNPFSPARGHTVRFQFPISGSSSVKYEIFNFAMEPVFKSGTVVRPGAGIGDQAGYGAVTWDGRSTSGSAIANGVYFYKIDVSGKEYWGKVMVID